ncbi:MAG: metal-dependent hydrolase [Pseudomonadota bacterium]
MANPDYVYEEKHVDKIVIRAFNFDFPDDLDPIWSPENRARSHMFNGLSLTMPYLEPYLIKSMQAATEDIDEPRLLEDIRDFNGQEARHYQCHRRMNELIKKNGYPELATVEESMAASYKKLLTKSLRTQLAYNAGFETMTNGFTNWLITKRFELFKNACPYVASFWLMHMIEEVEHKTVAFDAYMAHSGAYIPRLIGVFHGSLHVVGYGIVGMFTAIKKDRQNGMKVSRWSAFKEICSVITNVGPYLLRAALPGHNPRCEQDLQYMRDWIEGHSTIDQAKPLPLIDTRNPQMPIPFPQ